jgi:capsular polysaccharide biosynthesis protein
VVVWGQQAVSVFSKVYRTGDSDSTLREIIHNFKVAAETLQSSLSSLNQISPDEQGLLEIARTCQNAGDKFLKQLGPVTTQHKLLNSFKAIIKAPAVEELKKELSLCQQALETQLLADLR